MSELEQEFLHLKASGSIPPNMGWWEFKILKAQGKL